MLYISESNNRQQQYNTSMNPIPFFAASCPALTPCVQQPTQKSGRNKFKIENVKVVAVKYTMHFKLIMPQSHYTSNLKQWMYEGYLQEKVLSADDYHSKYKVQNGGNVHRFMTLGFLYLLHNSIMSMNACNVQFQQKVFCYSQIEVTPEEWQVDVK